MHALMPLVVKALTRRLFMASVILVTDARIEATGVQGVCFDAAAPHGVGGLGEAYRFASARVGHELLPAKVVSSWLRGPSWIAPAGLQDIHRCSC